MSVYLSAASWAELREELDEVCARHPLIFPDHQRGKRDFETWKPDHVAGDSERDPWGVLWKFDYDGLEGQAVEHPLDDWAKFDGFVAPDPMRFSDRGTYDWPKFHAEMKRRRERGELTVASLPHGYFLMRLWYLRGFENLMVDFALGEPRLHELCRMLVERNNAIVREFIHAGVDVVHFGEDIGTQTASIVSPATFRTWIVPAYQRMMSPVKNAGIIVDTHSDGYIIELVDDLIACGCDVLNPQDLCNGIDNIGRTMKGRVCIKLDVDRQKVVPFGTRAEIHALIEEEVKRLGSPQGGLQFVCGIYPPTPPENIDALCEAFEKYRRWWWS